MGAPVVIDALLESERVGCPRGAGGPRGLRRQGVGMRIGSHRYSWVSGTTLTPSVGAELIATPAAP